jgi:hypothetical protein
MLQNPLPAKVGEQAKINAALGTSNVQATTVVVRFFFLLLLSIFCFCGLLMKNLIVDCFSVMKVIKRRRWIKLELIRKIQSCLKIARSQTIQLKRTSILLLLPKLL